MGLSQLDYVGNNATISQFLTVSKVTPQEASANEDIMILGTNFGKETEKGKVLFEDRYKEEIGKQVFVQPEGIVENGQIVEYM